MEYRRAEVTFSQGDPCEHVLYLQKGGVKLSVLPKAGREAVVAMLGSGEFFGEGCLAGQPLRMGSATATTDCSVLLVDKDRMVRLLHKQHALSDRFIAHLLARNIRIEQDLIDQLFNSSEKRLARILLLLARYGTHRLHGWAQGEQLAVDRRLARLEKPITPFSRATSAAQTATGTSGLDLYQRPSPWSGPLGICLAQSISRHAR